METLKKSMQTLVSQLSNYVPDFDQEHHRRISKEIGEQLSVEEILKHPEFNHVNWDLKPEKREKVEVAKGRGGPFHLAYELHGRGPRKIVVCPIRTTSTLSHFFGVTRADSRPVDNGSRRLHESMAKVVKMLSSELKS